MWSPQWRFIFLLGQRQLPWRSLTPWQMGGLMFLRSHGVRLVTAGETSWVLSGHESGCMPSTELVPEERTHPCGYPEGLELKESPKPLPRGAATKPGASVCCWESCTISLEGSLQGPHTHAHVCTHTYVHIHTGTHTHSSVFLLNICPILLLLL